MRIENYYPPLVHPRLGTSLLFGLGNTRGGIKKLGLIFFHDIQKFDEDFFSLRGVFPKEELLMLYEGNYQYYLRGINNVI